MFTPENSLKPFNTFAIHASAQQIVTATSGEQIIAAWQQSQRENLPFIILGEGSNVLFIEDFSGIVVLNRLKGIDVTESHEHWLLHVAAGENWHQLVKYTLSQHIPGLENLALIPGCVGSSPIQNIGAYGVELKDVCAYVDVLDLSTGTTVRLTQQECQFGYRDSVFKHHYQSGYVIVAVGFNLPKQWQPVMTYGDLIKLDPASVTPNEIFESVCHMRSSKLPDPHLTGNAGSFFKNPVISRERAEAILAAYPGAPAYPQADGEIKLAAGWLIDRCDLKGLTIGGAAVHKQQALVLINQDQATAQDVVRLAREVRTRVGEKFDIWLEPEVRFIAAKGESNAVEVIS